METETTATHGGDGTTGRPWERRAAARTALVWEALQPHLGDTGAVIVDIGGGTGGLAVRAAEGGHQVTIVDPSPDALAAAARRAQESGVTDRVQVVQGDLTDLGAHVAPGSVDLVLCHEVLGLLDDPIAGLATITTTLRPGGVASIVVGQRHAAVLARAMAGQLDAARAVLDGTAEGPRLFVAEEWPELLAAVGCELVSIQGVRVFSDLVPSALIDLEPGADRSLLELERAVAGRPEYLPMATHLHVLARRGGA